MQMRGLLKVFLIILILTGIGVGLLGYEVTGRGTEHEEKLTTGEIPTLDRNAPRETETATLALGCFWSFDAKFGAVPGVVRTRVGYSGGTKENPRYYNLGDHTETVQIDYDPDTITYEGVLEVFWNSHNPTYPYDKRYMSIIFTHNDEQERIARASKAEEEAKRGENIVTKIRPYTEFHLAENYHQKYYLRQWAYLFDAYWQIYPETEKQINSTAMARVNGYVSGYGEVDSRDDLNGLGLTQKGKKRVAEAREEATGTSCGICWNGNCGPTRYIETTCV